MLSFGLLAVYRALRGTLWTACTLPDAEQVSRSVAVNLQYLNNLTLLVVAAVYGFLLTLSSVAGLFGIPLAILVTLSLWRYSYTVLRHAARDTKEIPPPDIESMNPVGEFTLIVHFVLFPTVIWLSVSFPFGAGPVVDMLRATGTLILIVAFPASAALMGMTSNLAESLNPKSIVSLIRTFGSTYAALLVTSATLVLLLTVAQELLQRAPGLVALLLYDVFLIWALLANFALIGAAIYKQRDAFDVAETVESTEERLQRQTHSDWQKTLDLAYASIRSGLVAEGYQTLKQFIEKENETIELHYWLFEKMLSWEDNSHALQVAVALIDHLIEAGEHYKAIKLFTECQHISPSFAIAAGSAASLADYAREIGWHAVAEQLAEHTR